MPTAVVLDTVTILRTNAPALCTAGAIRLDGAGRRFFQYSQQRKKKKKLFLAALKTRAQRGKNQKGGAGLRPTQRVPSKRNRSARRIKRRKVTRKWAKAPTLMPMHLLRKRRNSEGDGKWEKEKRRRKERKHAEQEVMRNGNVQITPKPAGAIREQWTAHRFVGGAPARGPRASSYRSGQPRERIECVSLVGTFCSQCPRVCTYTQGPKACSPQIARGKAVIREPCPRKRSFSRAGKKQG